MDFRWRIIKATSRVAPWLLFLATLGGVAALRSAERQSAAAVGFAAITTEEIAALEGGRLAQVLVTAGQRVEAGQVLAVLDETALQAEIALSLAEEQQARAELDGAGQDVLSRSQIEQADLTRQVEAVRLDIARESTDLDQARARLAALTTERTRLGELLEQKLTTQVELAAVEAETATLQAEVDARTRSLDELQSQLTAAQTRLQEITLPPPQVAAAPLEAWAEASQRRQAWLELRREALNLRAPSGGTVVSIHKQAGEILTPAQSVLTLLLDQPASATVCLTEQDAGAVQVGARAILSPRGRAGELAGEVAALSPLVAPLPERCRANPTVVTWGRVARVALAAEVSVLPGELFDVKIARGAPASPPAEGAQAAVVQSTPAAEGEPRPLLLPEGSTLRLEASGAAWSPELAAWLLVSDDTGITRQNRHAPILFALRPQGGPPEALEVQGAAGFNDLEGITRAEDGRWYATSSQSHNKDGERKKARSSLFALSVAEGQIVAQKEVQLAEMLDRASPEILAQLGLPGSTRELDVEGLCAHGGALYFGLKAPLGPSGEATIWRAERPAELLNGDLEGAGLTRWATVHLKAQVDGEEVPAGISELIFSPQGELLLSATPSGTKEGRQSGALYRVRAPTGGQLEAERVMTFAGLKPEGLARGSADGQMLVVFDGGDSPSSWLEVPWPG